MGNFINRFGLIIIINALIMVTISVMLNVFNIHPYMGRVGLNYGTLMIYCAVWGFGGAFISLFLSKFMAKTMMGVQIIDPNSPQSPRALWLVQTVHRLARQAGLANMPEVGIYDSSEMNAFATGPSRSNSMVAVSQGLLERMTEAEVEGVLAHEVAHIANGDMVTMTLIQGVVNAFGMFLARVIGHLLSKQVDEDKAPMVNFIATFIFDLIFNFLGMFVVAYYSRQREYRADKGAATFGSRDKMIAALKRLQTEMTPPPTEQSPLATMQISNRKEGWLSLLSTHPSLENRIAKLQSF